jgi:3-hydroxyisobutyrate dehydrogenase
MQVGFVGLGTMGMPMARRVLGAGIALRVWNRTPERSASLLAEGAEVATSIDELFSACDVVLVMLLDRHAVDAALGRGTPAFASRVANRTLVMLGTTSAEYSRELDADVRAHGGHYVEAPVSGSRVPAEQGALVGMLAGSEERIRAVEPLLAPLCREIVHCGAVPNALRLKLAVNHYLIATVAALAEATAVADALGIDLALFRRVLDAGPMASAVSRAKLEKLVQRDFSPQAAIRDVAQIATLVADQARMGDVSTPLMDTCERMFAAARERGLSGLDMIAVLQPAPENR